jgi:hypothetical protein
MTSLTKTRSRVKPERSCRLGNPVNGVRPLLITTGTGPKAKNFGYYLTAIPTDLGRGFHLEKLPHQVEDDGPDSYDVLIDPRDVRLPPGQPGHSTCECMGHLRWRHQTVCKHIASLLVLIKEGQL